MKIRILKIIPVMLIVASCSTEHENGLVINGKFTNAQGKTVYLDELTPTAVLQKDSVKVDENGGFVMKWKAMETSFYRIRLAQNNFVNIIAGNNDIIEISADANNLYNTYKTSGTADVEELWELNRYLRSYNYKVDSLKGLIQAYRYAPEFPQMQSAITVEYSTINRMKEEFIKSFIVRNKGSIIALAAIEQLNPENDIDYFKMIDQKLMESYPESQYTKHFHSKIAGLMRLAPGSAAPEITMNDPDGNPVFLSSLRGKVVMIDFWASWCKPCRIENPNVVRIYNKYKDKGFEIFGVSLDKNQAAWIQAIKQDKLSWIHASDLSFWNSPIVNLYDVKGIPLTYLLDQNGVIIAKGLRGEALEAKLQEIFGES